MECYANNSPTTTFNSVPKIGLSFGPDEFISTKDSSFAIDDDVIWTIGNAESPLLGRIEFLGRSKDHDSGRNRIHQDLVAVVIFDQPTCHLPNHLINPPCNRNVVPLEQLVKKGQGQWQVITMHSGTPLDIQLIGNCIATVHQNFESTFTADFSAGDAILVKTGTGDINGRIMITGNMKEKSDGEFSIVSCVGVKFEKSLNSFPEIKLRHLNDDDGCRKCAGGTLAFVPLKLLAYVKKENGAVDCRDIVEVKAKIVSEVQPLPKPKRSDDKENLPTPAPKKAQKPASMFVGNCVAVAKGTEKTTLKGVRMGDRVYARNAGQTIIGVARLICTVNDLEGEFKDSTYVGVQFKSSFVDLCQSEQVIQHHNLRGKPASSCKRCEGGKLIFIPADFLIPSKNSPTAGDVTFEVAPK